MRLNVIIKEGQVWVRVLIKHPMETGLRKDKASGELIPPHFIKQLQVEHNGALVSRVNCGVAVSKNPFFFFKLKNGAVGDTIRIAWEDNKGQTEQVDHKIE